MKILVVNSSDSVGGAARAARRLHQSLLSIGLDSKMLVQHKVYDDPSVFGPPRKFGKGFALMRPTLDMTPNAIYAKRNGELFSNSIMPSSRLVKEINELNPDIVHLHWINGGMISVADLSKIKAPLVWSLHDMWPFTGGCHYDNGCAGYLSTCGKCPLLGSSYSIDMSKINMRRKARAYKKIKMLHVNALSEWLLKTAKSSSLFSGVSIGSIPNPIDTNQFSPHNKSLSRKLFGLPADKKLVLFGAMNAATDKRKGFDLLLAALNKLDDNSDIELVVFGASAMAENERFRHRIHFIGNLVDDVALQLLYDACDVMVVPSVQENLSNAIMESMAVGTPVVAFNIGGNPDLICHLQDGYLADPYSTSDLAKGIKFVLETDRGQLGNIARTNIIRKFEQKTIAMKYRDLYADILDF